MENKEIHSTSCGVAFCMSMIGGKWKPIILFRISKGVNRFNKLINEIEGINRQMLSKQLKEMERAGILERTMFPEIPPRVEYKLTTLGKTLLPIIKSMDKWGQKQQEGPVLPKATSTQQLPLFE